MHFKEIGIIISKKLFKENSYIVTVFTQNRGIYSGVVRRISNKDRALYTEGNLIDFHWQARLIDHLGSAKCDIIKSYSAYLIIDKLKLYSFNSIISLIKLAFIEREPHVNLFPVLKKYLDKMSGEFSFRDYVNFELSILTEAGYGLSLDACAVTGQKEDLCFVSPKSGKAVSYEAGKPYAEKLLTLPKILRDSEAPVNYSQIKQSFELTGYFLNRYFFQNKAEPKERLRLFEALLNLYK